MSASKEAAYANPQLLTARFRKSSRSIHNLSESLVYGKLLVAFTNRRLYGQALSRFWFVLSDIERRLKEHKTHPDIRPIAELLPEFGRTAGFSADLEYFLGPRWRDQIQPSVEVQAYLTRLDRVSRENPLLLLAHSYTQHMGLAFGGQIVGRMARRTMSLPADKGTAAFEYREPVTQVRKRYCAALNQVAESFSEDQIRQLLEERHQVFQFNNAIIGGFQVGYCASLLALPKLFYAPLLVALLLVAGAVVVSKVLGLV